MCDELNYNNFPPLKYQKKKIPEVTLALFLCMSFEKKKKVYGYILP